MLQVGFRGAVPISPANMLAASCTVICTYHASAVCYRARLYWLPSERCTCCELTDTMLSLYGPMCADVMAGVTAAPAPAPAAREPSLGPSQP